MRVLHVIPGIAPRYGGPSTVIFPLCAALSRLPGVQVEIATTDADGTGRKLDCSRLPQSPVPLHLFPRDFSERWKFSRGLAGWLWHHARDYDVLHVHALWSFSTSVACAAGRRHGIPVVLRPCGMLSEYTWGRSALMKQLYWRAVERRNLASARWIHATSTDEAREVAALRLPGPDRTVVIPNGIDEVAWQIKRRPEVLRQRCGSRVGDRPIILFLSRLHPKKGIVDLLLPAFARLKTDAFLAIAGGSDEHEPGYERVVRGEIARLGLNDRITMLGPVSPEERWWMYDGAAAFALPSHSENFGIVVIEAMARGLPVMVSEAVQGGEHVRQAEAGMVVPLRIDSITASLQKLLAGENGVAKMAERGRAYVREHLNWDAIASRLASVYDS